MLQRSWTVEQEHAANDAGAVYVGRASFRMGGTPTQTSSAVGARGAGGDGADEDFFAAELPFESSGLSELPVVPRVPTERIVLAPGSPLQAPSPGPEGAGREAAAAAPRSILVSFGGAFLVGVVCTMAGQVALHWRAHRLGAGSVAGAPAPTRPLAPPVAEPPARLPESAAAPSHIAPAVVVVPAAPAEVVLPQVESPTARAEDLAVSEARTHSRATRRQVVSAPVAVESSKDGNSKDGTREGSTTQEGSVRETGATRRTASETSKKRGRVVWIDPFAEDGEAPAGNANDRGAPGVGAGQPAGGGIDSVGQLTSSASRSPSASRSAVGPRALTTRGPRWVDPFAE